MLQIIRDLLFPKAYDLSARRPRPAAAATVSAAPGAAGAQASDAAAEVRTR
jgi:hypothetical protein